MSELNENMLSANDEDILNSIFSKNNESISFSNTCFHDSALDEENKVGEKNANFNLNETNQLEVQGIRLAENGKLQEAIAILTKAIENIPNHASLYNNRAQVYRLLDDDEAALEDIQIAIKLCDSKGDIFCKALCQRGILHFKHRRDAEAIEDFQKAASLGSQFAKEQMVKLNPYATLCNATLKKVFQLKNFE